MNIDTGTDTNTNTFPNHDDDNEPDGNQHNHQQHIHVTPSPPHRSTSMGAWAPFEQEDYDSNTLDADARLKELLGEDFFKELLNISRND